MSADGDGPPSIRRPSGLGDALVAMGMVSETFETAITWDRFADFHAEVVAITE
jgi:alkyldihydroxyacetonephosphate synthase